MARTSLQCRECKKEYPSTFKYICDDCFGPLDVKYDFPTITKDTFTNRENTYWRYFELLPIEDKIRYRRDKVTKLLSEGCTQLEISNKTHCSLSTIEKDISAIRTGN